VQGVSLRPLYLLSWHLKDGAVGDATAPGPPETHLLGPRQQPEEKPPSREQRKELCQAVPDASRWKRLRQPPAEGRSGTGETQPGDERTDRSGNSRVTEGDIVRELHTVLLPLYSALVRPPSGVLCPVLGSPLQER